MLFLVGRDLFFIKLKTVSLEIVHFHLSMKNLAPIASTKRQSRDKNIIFTRFIIQSTVSFYLQRITKVEQMETWDCLRKFIIFFYFDNQKQTFFIESLSHLHIGNYLVASSSTTTCSEISTLTLVTRPFLTLSLVKISFLFWLSTSKLMRSFGSGIVPTPVK